MPDRHREKPLSLRLGPDRQRLEDFATDTGQPVRRVIADAVRAWLDDPEKAERARQVEARTTNERIRVELREARERPS